MKLTARQIRAVLGAIDVAHECTTKLDLRGLAVAEEKLQKELRYHYERDVRRSAAKWEQRQKPVVGGNT